MLEPLQRPGRQELLAILKMEPGVIVTALYPDDGVDRHGLADAGYVDCSHGPTGLVR